MNVNFSRTAAVFFGAALCATLVPSPAEACGGFFCSFNQPVNQAAERIVFVSHENGDLTAIIQIQYQGPSENFSWVLPVPGVPDVAVSSNIAFTRLQSNTNPNYQLTTEVEGECANSFNRGGGLAPGSAVADSDDGFNSAPPPEAQEPDVTVVGGGSVGPYDYEVISLRDGLDDPADVAIEWLTENEYDVGELGPDVLRPYLQNGLNLLAFRLQKEADAGSIRPVAVTWQPMPMGMGQAAGKPAIPIRPTAVAANDNMGVMVWNVGPARAVPTNYRSLKLNDAMINWFNASSNYNDVINIAADEAGGHGFVTEMAQPSSRVQDVIWSPFDQTNFDNLTQQDYDGRESTLLLQSTMYGGWDGYADAFREAVPASVLEEAGVDVTTFSQCPGCYLNFDEAIPELDEAAFKNALNTHIIEPMKATQDLMLEREYVTRLYTTMSADEMDQDPEFDFNDTLDDIDNQHDATRVVECNLGVSQFEAPWRVELPTGLVVRGEGQGTWPVSTDTEDMPANLRVEQDNILGQPEVIDDNTDKIELRLQEINSLVPRVPPPMATCTCATPGEDAVSGVAGLAVLGLLGGMFHRRRRR